MKILPKNIILKFDYEIHVIYDNLPENLKNDPDVLLNLKCFEHYNLPTSRDHIDGPPPPRKNCPGCKRGDSGI